MGLGFTAFRVQTARTDDGIPDTTNPQTLTPILGTLKPNSQQR